MDGFCEKKGVVAPSITIHRKVVDLTVCIVILGIAS